MKLKLVLLNILFCLSVLGQDKFTISGYIKDAKNGEALIGATVSKKGTGIGASANEYGFFALTLPKGEQIILVSIIGYKTFEFSVTLDKNINKTF